MPKTVLIVDDDTVNLLLVKRTLLTKDYEVLTAQDGLEALEVLKTKKPDLILLDVQMPKMNGYAFIMEKTKNPAIASIPVIVLTASKDTGPLFKRHGVKAYLIKPLDPQILLEKVQSIVSP